MRQNKFVTIIGIFVGFFVFQVICAVLSRTAASIIGDMSVFSYSEDFRGGALFSLVSQFQTFFLFLGIVLLPVYLAFSALDIRLQVDTIAHPYLLSRSEYIAFATYAAVITLIIAVIIRRVQKKS